MSPIHGLPGKRVETDPSSADHRLRGRTYAIPFERVWEAALALASSDLPDWEVTEADEQKGVIEAETKTWLLRAVVDVRITVTLDENAQTRVDLVSSCRSGTGTLGKNARRVGHFLDKLDQRLDAKPEEILDPTKTVWE